MELVGLRRAFITCSLMAGRFNFEVAGVAITHHSVRGYGTSNKTTGTTRWGFERGWVTCAVQAFLDQCRRDLRRLRVAWIEVKVGPGRLVAYNPNGYQFKVKPPKLKGKWTCATIVT